MSESNQAEREFSTPMMQQYISIKQEYPDCLLFFRLGDFYELFLEDAQIGAKVLDITLTRRPRGKDGDIPMAGVPFHAADAYIAKLVNAGYKIAICEQVSDPSAKGIVDREVVRIVTPGTILDEKNLTQKEHNFTVGVHVTTDSIGLAAADVSTGVFYVRAFKHDAEVMERLSQELAELDPRECIVSKEIYDNPEVLGRLSALKGMNVFPYVDWNLYTRDPKATLYEHFNVKTLQGFGIEEDYALHCAAAALLGYIKYTQRDKAQHIRYMIQRSDDDHMQLDHATVVNLELFETLRDHEKHGSLIAILDHTHTAMGGRLLRTWMRRPLIEQERIQKRLNAVEVLLKNPTLRSALIESLKPIYDIERIVSRLSVGVGNAYDVVNLKQSLIAALGVKEVLTNVSDPLLKELADCMSTTVEEVVTLIDTVIVDDPPFDLRTGGLIKPGNHEHLDAFREKITEGKTWIAELESSERKKSGISNLRVKYNKVFGYFIEVSKAHAKNVPDYFVRKQTMVNAERYITPELKEYEDTVLRGEEKSHALEYELFLQTVKKILKYIDAIQRAATALAGIDCLVSFAYVAEQYQYVKPELVEGNTLSIVEGRHPVVETLLSDPFVPNNVELNQTEQQLLIITGPNMAGKSVFMRQVALIVLLAHIGCFVPATKTTLSVVDRIFVRSGASDIISSGLSTFMVEMVETANILRHATEKSLVIMDEIGRGTSTYDGISIAWAVAEHLVSNPSISAKTLFATHYHELQELEERHPDKIKNYHLAVEEHKGSPVFLHTLTRGGASHSYAIAVAKLAGVPDRVTIRASSILLELEKLRAQTETAEVSLQRQIDELELDSMTPMEALETLKNLQNPSV